MVDYGDAHVPHVGLVPESVSLVSASIVKTRKARKARGQALGLAICAAGVGAWIPVITVTGPVSAWTVVEVVVGVVLVTMGLLVHEKARGLPVAPPPRSTVWLGRAGERRLEWFKRLELRRGVWTIVGEELDRC